MSCYYVKGKRKISIQKIMNEFYKETLIITNAEVFSSDELVENTYTKRTDLESSSNYESSKNIGTLDFITKENEIRGKIGFNELMSCFKSAKRNI